MWKYLIHGDENRRKEGKIAIPDLQVGDILDYYLRHEKLQEYVAEVQGAYTFFLGASILFYTSRYDCSWMKKAVLNIFRLMDAPALKESRDDDDNIVLSLEEKNLAKLQSSLFHLALQAISLHRCSKYVCNKTKVMQAHIFTAVK
jgi:hypothetical protein